MNTPMTNVENGSLKINDCLVTKNMIQGSLVQTDNSTFVSISTRYFNNVLTGSLPVFLSAESSFQLLNSEVEGNQHAFIALYMIHCTGNSNITIANSSLQVSDVQEDISFSANLVEINHSTMIYGCGNFLGQFAAVNIYIQSSNLISRCLDGNKDIGIPEVNILRIADSNFQNMTLTFGSDVKLMTLRTCFTSGNTTMTSADVDFFKRAQKAGMIEVQSGFSVQQGETVFASSEYVFTIP